MTSYVRTYLCYGRYMTELEALAREVGVNERTLRRAVDQGTLRGARPSPRKIELPMSERQYVRRSWGLLGSLRAALRTERNVRFALLFGSFARGTATPASDIDVLVDLSDASLERVIDLEEKLSAASGRRVEVVRLEDAEAEPAFLAELVAHGRVLVDRDQLWPRLRGRMSRLRPREREREAQRTEAALAGIDRLLAA